MNHTEYQYEMRAQRLCTTASMFQYGFLIAFSLAVAVLIWVPAYTAYQSVSAQFQSALGAPAHRTR